jgi:hypothetical protein
VFPSSSFLFRSNSPSLFSFKRALSHPSKIPLSSVFFFVFPPPLYCCVGCYL